MILELYFFIASISNRYLHKAGSAVKSKCVKFGFVLITNSINVSLADWQVMCPICT